MQPDELELLLHTSNTSYQFLLHLAQLAKDSPGLLAPRSIALLRTKTGCVQWIRENQNLIPLHLQPKAENLRAFSMLFRSYFLVSFHFDTMKWNGEVLDTNLLTGTKCPKTAVAKGSSIIKFYAVKHLLTSKGISLNDKALKRFVRLQSIHEEVTLWTYVWELRQRAKGKSKGATVHKLWLSMPYKVRKNITLSRVVEASEILCAKSSRPEQSVCS